MTKSSNSIYSPLVIIAVFAVILLGYVLYTTNAQQLDINKIQTTPMASAAPAIKSKSDLDQVTTQLDELDVQSLDKQLKELDSDISAF